MSDTASATVQMDENGRVTIPKSTRIALEVEDTPADLDLRITVLDRGTENTTKGQAD